MMTLLFIGTVFLCGFSLGITYCTITSSMVDAKYDREEQLRKAERRAFDAVD